jgi:hypothetical protein
MKAILHALAIGLLLSLSACSQIQEFTLKDARAAKSRAERNADLPGAKCWGFVEAQLVDEFEAEIAGVMDLVEAARVVRLKAPALRKQISESCGEVLFDLIVELAKKAGKKGL